ncbi:MAG: ATP-dependent Clp protease proteolytic subunit [Paraclostridium sp.]
MRYINIIGEINDKLVKDTLDMIFKIEMNDNKIIEENNKLSDTKHHKKLEDLTVNITSVGGLVYGTNAIYDALSKLKCKVITRGYGICSSGGFWLLLAGQERYAGKHTEFLYHTMGYGTYYDKLQNHIDYAKYQTVVQSNLDKIVLEKTKITKKILKEKRKDDWWILYPEALELGIVHGEI